MSNLCRYLLLTRLPKFHRGKGSRHLGYYVTYFFFYFSVDDVMLWGSLQSFMNDVSVFGGKQLQLRVQAG